MEGRVATRIVNLLVGPESDGMRLDAFLAMGPDMPSRSACARLVEEGSVTINTCEATSKSEKVLLGDRVTCELKVEEKGAEAGLLTPNPEIPLDIRYEDEHLIVLSKQAGLVCHPSPVHRLDMDTSGLMVAAKSDEVQKALQDLIRLRVLDRRYVVLVHGYVAHDKGTIVTGIARSTRDRLRMTVTDDPAARESITTYTTLERFEAGRRDEGYSLLECHLYTGRTHQIRVHMRHTGHPVVGDQLYGRGDDRTNHGLRRQFLHSWHIAFDHPVTGEPIERADRLPDDLLAILEGLKETSMGRTEAGERICPQLGASW